MSRRLSRQTRSTRAASCGLLLLAALGGSAGCAYRRACVRVDEPPRPTGSAAADTVSVRFLGVSGVLVRLGGSAVLTAPLYSNPTLGEIAFQQVHSDHRLIDALLPRDMKDVQAILSGHSHYDHLMDVPHVAIDHCQKATVVGNDELPKLLAPLARPGGALAGRLLSLEPVASEGEPPPGGNVCPAPDPSAPPAALRSGCRRIGNLRIWPILSEHSSQFRIRLPLVGKLPLVHLWRGALEEPVRELPSTPSGWVEGTTLAYIVDFMDGETIAFRLYYQDSGSRDPYGFPPRRLLAQHPVDLAVLCVGGDDFAKTHPAAIVRALNPHYVIAAHWEDFFNPRRLPRPKPDGTSSCAGITSPRQAPKECRERIDAIPSTDPRDFAKRLRRALPKQSAFVVPCPDAWATLTRAQGSWTLARWSESWTSGSGEDRSGGN